MMALEYPNPINWHNFALAQDYYARHNFKYIEVPWLAPAEIMHITFPGEYRFKTELGDLIASGEQAFLYLESKNKLDPGRYMTITPCFRDEEETKFNFKQFMKLELYITDSVTLENLQKTISICKDLLENILNGPIEIVSMLDGSFDLEYQKIELGSYGIREYRGHKWIYATGLAEPRTSQVKNIYKEHIK